MGILYRKLCLNGKEFELLPQASVANISVNEKKTISVTH